MRKIVFLFVFSFSLFLPVMMMNGNYGSTKTDKLLELVKKPTPKTVEENIIEVFSKWQSARASYYDSQDSTQTRSGGNGMGAFGHLIASGSIAFGSSFTELFKEKGMEVFIEVKNLNVMTPYGKGIFRIDDVMANKYNRGKHFYLDFFHKDLDSNHKRQGRFRVDFRIIKIVSADS